MKERKGLITTVILLSIITISLATYIIYEKKFKEETIETNDNIVDQTDKNVVENKNEENNKENNNEPKLNFVGDKEDLLSGYSGAGYDVYYINKDSELVYYYVQTTEPYDVVKEKASIPEKVVQISNRSASGGGNYVFALTESGNLYIRKSPGSTDYNDPSLYSFIKVTSPEEIVGLEYKNLDSEFAHNSRVDFIGKSGKKYYEICEEDYDKGIVKSLTLTEDVNISDVCYFK